MGTLSSILVYSTVDCSRNVRFRVRFGRLLFFLNLFTYLGYLGCLTGYVYVDYLDMRSLGGCPINLDSNDSFLPGQVSCCFCFRYRVRQKSNPLKLLAVFSATVWNFCEILHVYVTFLSTRKCH